MRNTKDMKLFVPLVEGAFLAAVLSGQNLQIDQIVTALKQKYVSEGKN